MTEFYHIYGTGIKTDDIQTTPDRIRDFIHLAPAFEKQLLKDLEESGVSESEFRNFDTERLCEEISVTAEELMDRMALNMHSFANLIAFVMREQEDINLTVCDDDHDNVYCILQNDAPWNMNDRTKMLTEDSFKELLGKHLKVLTDQSVDELDFGFQAIEDIC